MERIGLKPFPAFASPPNNAPLLFGATGGCPTSGTFIGLIDEVKLFNRALTEAEIKAVFEAAR